MAWTVSPGLQLLLSVLVTLTLSSAEEIRVPPSIVSLVEPQQLLYSYNDRLEVKCSATGQPPPTYKWLWNGNEINSDYITFSAATGILTIYRLTSREEGLFVCYARSTFSNLMTATGVSATLEIRVARIEDFIKRPLAVYTGTEGNYATIPCDKDLPKYYGAITFKWYTVLDKKHDEVQPDERKIIDQGGNLHFSYVLKSDEMAGSTPYKCAIANKKFTVVRLGNENSLTVTSTGSVPNSAPRLQYNTSGSFLTVEAGENATLECVFSGYVSSSNQSETVPRVTWYDQDGRAITQGGCYDITSNGRSLTIMNVTEDDEKTYRCRGNNSLGSDEGILALNVTSRPIWVHRLESTTVVEGKDAVFHCVTRSAKGEQSPSQPKWALNTKQMGSTYDPNKYQFNADKTTLTVKFVNKDRDIACFQCKVANSVGEVYDDGCVNVIKPIEIRVRPAAEQSVQKGDVVDLTVVASTDPLYAPVMTYSWIFKNVAYSGDKAPPSVTLDHINNLAYINTSRLTDVEFKQIDGLYRRVISHSVETVYVDVIVELKVEKPIEIRVRPAAEQSVKKGDVVDLTVVASTHPLFEPHLTYSWIFKNVTFSGDKAPPYVTLDHINNLAYINTSGLTDEEFKQIDGLYRKVISHSVETIYVDVIVKNTLFNRVLSKIEKQSEVLQNVVHELNQITMLLLKYTSTLFWPRRAPARDGIFF